ARALLLGYLPPAFQPSPPAGRGPRRTGQPERRAHRTGGGDGLRAPRGSRLRPPAAPAPLAHPRGAAGPAPLLRRGAPQLPRRPLSVRGRRPPPALRAAGRAAALARRHVGRRGPARRALRQPPAAPGAARPGPRSVDRGPPGLGTRSLRLPRGHHPLLLR